MSGFSYKRLLDRLRARVDQAEDLVAEGDRFGAAVQARKVMFAADAGVDRLLADRGPNLTGADRRTIDELHELRDYADGIVQRHEEVDQATQTRAAQLRAAERYGGTAVTRIRVGEERQVYDERSPYSFFKDLALADGRGDYGARERLERHARAGGLPEQRASSTSGLAGLVPPAFLPELFAEEARSGGVLVGLAASERLPAEGMTLTIPLSSTPTLVSSQSTDNQQVANQDVTATDLEVPVRVLAGYIDISWQSIERGHLVDRLIFSDLMGAWLEEHDRQAIVADGTLGTHFGILSTTGIGTVTVQSTEPLFQWKRVGEAVAGVGQARKRPATAIVMAPRRWGAWTVATDSQGRPLFDSSGDGQNTIAQGAPAAEGLVGRAHGVPVYADAEIPLTESHAGVGNEDVIVVTRASDLLVWRDNTPLVARFDSVGSSTLTARLIIHGYAAFAAGLRPESTLVCSGSGLTTPTFA